MKLFWEKSLDWGNPWEEPNPPCEDGHQWPPDPEEGDRCFICGKEWKEGDTRIITIDEDQSYAPGCYLICKVHGEPGHYDWDTQNEEETIVIQCDYNIPSIASNFGFQPCICGETDGTVDCKHKTAGQMIEEAAEFLDSLILSPEDSRFIEDPGYFLVDA
jgi:hypothetical protein